jgi:hypothetical protein
MPGNLPMQLIVTVTFEEFQGKTKMTIQHTGLPTGEIINNERFDWNESFDKLAELLTQI